MSSLKPFQRKTAKRAVRALRRKDARRFLIADEVGLGKTLIAVDVVDRLANQVRKTEDRPLRVFYLCSNLAIGHQNRKRFARLNGLETTNVDRLTLVPASRKMSFDARVHFYTLTANTSFPDRKGKSRDGTWQERALLSNLLKRADRRAIREPWLRGRVYPENWGWYLARDRVQPSSGLVRAFRRRLLALGGLADRRGISRFIRHWRRRDSDIGVIGKLRKLLAEIALETVAPDLVILDEFQRFRDLMHLDESGAGRVAQLLLEPQEHAPPAVLLLSATPYKAYDSQFEKVFGDKPHHEQLLELYGWLEGGRKPGKRARSKLERAFRSYGDALRHEPDSVATREARDKVQARLKRRVARTERYRHAHGQEAAPPPEPIRSPLLPGDLASFRHTVDCFQPNPGARSYAWSAVPYWRSVPLPMQTLGAHYKPWKAAHAGGRIKPPPAEASLSPEQRDQFVAPANWPHPQLRSLLEAYPPDALSTPWVSPSRRWWPASGPWAAGVAPRKALVFSRFIAVPRAVSTLMSFDAERSLLAGWLDPASESDIKPYAAATRRRPLHFSPETLALFHPALWLAEAVDPSLVASVEHALETARTSLRGALNGRVAISGSKTPSRSLANLIVEVEHALGVLPSSREGWMALAADVAKGRAGEGDSDHSLRARVAGWLTDSSGEAQEPPSITEGDLDLLAAAALDLPGVVLARALRRHWPALATNKGGQAKQTERFTRVLMTAWQGLRAYLNNPWFAARLERAYGPPDSESLSAEQHYGAHLRRAVRDGNLESLLDEHFYITKTLRALGGGELCDALQNALALRVASPTLHHPTGGSFKLRAHAVMPFSDGVSVARAGGPDREEKARADELRTSFNSPFWPHVLVTTSVGQEGLDFHVWCDTIVHWDLPSNPVDLEQREGRVNRFGGLAIRRALATHPDLAEARTWDLTNALANGLEDETGLAPWWVLEGAAISRRVFDVPLSEANQAFDALQRRRMLYRLALGQPDQESFVAALPDNLPATVIRDLTIDLG